MLASMSAPGTDIALAEDRILGARAFANKIWNAARFLFMNLEKAEAAAGFTLDELAAPAVRAAAPYAVKGEGELVHRWIFSRLAAAAGETGKALDEFRFHEACQTIYHFFWGDFCDWYIEWVKPQLSSADREVALAAWRNIFAVLDAALRLLHPVMPFLTEELWHKLPQPEGARSIALDKFPDRRPELANPTAVQQMKRFQEIVLMARQIRAERKIDLKRRVSFDLSIEAPWYRAEVIENLEAISRLTFSELRVSRGTIESVGRTVRSTDWFDLALIDDDVVDKPAEIAKLKKDIERLEKDISGKQARIGDPEFRSKAPRNVVDDLAALLVQRQLELKKLQERLKQLE